MAKIELRRARREDLGAIEEVFRSCAPDCDLGLVRQYYEERFGALDEQGDSTVLVGVSEGRVVGVIGLAVDRYETNDVFWLSWFQADREDEGSRRLAAKLLERVVKEVKRRGGRKIFTDTGAHASREIAARRYTELGFVVEARLEDFYGEGADQVIYGLDLARWR